MIKAGKCRKLSLKQAQGSIEYIIIAAIILILAAAATTVFIKGQQASQNNAQAAASIYWENADFKILALQANTTKARIEVQNNLNYIITVNEIKLNQYQTLVDITLEPGQTTEQVVTYIHNEDVDGSVFSITPTFGYNHSTQQLTFEGQRAITGTISTGII